MALIDDVKQSLRISTTALDTEVQDLIHSAKDDMRLSGILELKIIDETDNLIKRAIILYSKAYFGLSNADGERYKTAYENLKTHLCLSREYTEL